MNPVQQSESESTSDTNSSSLGIENIYIQLKGDTSGVGNEDRFEKLIKRKISTRAITKHGTCNFTPEKVKEKRRKFIADLCTTLLEVPWRWTLLAFCVTYFGSWFIFAVLWYLILDLHGDPEHFQERDWRPCITGIQNFTSAFLFSVETQHTTGYGSYQITESCLSAVLLFCSQSIIGVLLKGVMVGIVFAKVSWPRSRSETIMFSKNAVISKQTFMFRIADMRTTPLLKAHVRAQLIKKRTTKEGETVIYNQEELPVKGDGEKDKILLFWPTLITHEINENSPLREFKEKDFATGSNNKFEIIVVLEGILKSTGLNVQARSSYLPEEILCNRRFKDLGFSRGKDGSRTINYSLFHETMPCSES